MTDEQAKEIMIIKSINEAVTIADRIIQANDTRTFKDGVKAGLLEASNIVKEVIGHDE